MSRSAAQKSLLRYQIFGISLLALLLGGVGVWAATAEISGAVIAPGTVVVETSPKKVQHLEGGIIAEINVRNGDMVETGQLLFKLDDTEIRANLQIIEVQLEELKARRARLQAERDNAEALQIADDILNDLDPARRSVWEGQARLLETRREVRLGKEQQLQERVAQLLQAVKGLEAQQQAKERQIALIGEELESLLILQEQQLVTKPKILALQRETSRLEGERGQYVSDIARMHVQVSETRLQLAEVRQAFLSSVLAELREAEVNIAELSERAVAIAARLKRLSILAPRSGIAHKLSVHTVGGVISPGEAILEIVPREDKLMLEGQLEPANIDHVRTGQAVAVRLMTVDQRATPEIEGMLMSVSPDVRQDGPNLPRYYALRVALNDGELGKLGFNKLVPGMPVELLIRRSDRTVLNYLAKPFLDRLAHVFREE